MLPYWLRAVRIRFLLASVIAVILGLAVNWWQHDSLDLAYAGLTLAGVVSLHASVDLLNDYWDYKRKIDTETKRTKFSGGTGVLPDGLLKPSQVYQAGIAMLVIGAIIGSYFVIERGITIAVILLFAIISIYFYSTRIVDSGLGEVFVAIKGTMIVLGTYFVQAQNITIQPVIIGIISGILSSTVLFVNSFPDYEADKAHGRRTLVIVLGKAKAASGAWAFPSITSGIIVSSVVVHILPAFSLVALAALPIAVKSCHLLKETFDRTDEFVPVMKNIVSYSRITGILLIIGFIADHFIGRIH